MTPRRWLVMVIKYDVIRKTGST